MQSFLIHLSADNIQTLVELFIKLFVKRIWCQTPVKQIFVKQLSEP
jgi:hypothetical protein